MPEATLTKKQQKRAMFEKFLEHGDAFLFLDPRKEGVVVPSHLRKQSSLSLQFNYNLVIPIRDLAITDTGVTGTLSFDRSPFWCSIPWDVVFAVSGGGEFWFGWTDDFPPDLPKEEKNSPTPPKGRHLRSV